MTEKHIAYNITQNTSGLVCTHSEFEEDKMVDLLKEIQAFHSNDIYWVFRQFTGKPQEPLCIIDCSHSRIYYHHSGEVDNITDVVKKLSGETSC